MTLPAAYFGLSAQGAATNTQRIDPTRSSPDLAVASMRTDVTVGAAQLAVREQVSAPASTRDGTEGSPPPVVMSDFTVASHLAPAKTALAGGGVENSAPELAKTEITRAAQDADVAPTANPATAQANTVELAANVASSQTAGATVQTIANSTVDLARTMAAAATAAARAPAAVDMPPQVAPARTMTLQLAPADLGTVAVRLHMTGSSLDVQLSFSDSSTLSLVSHDRDALAGALDRDGYHVASLVLQSTASALSPTPSPATPASGDQGASMQASSGGTGSQASDDGRMSRGGGGGGGGSGSDQPSTGRRNDPHDAPASARDQHASGMFV